MKVCDTEDLIAYETRQCGDSPWHRQWMASMVMATDPFQDIGIGCCGVCPPDASYQLENGEFPFADND